MDSLWREFVLNSERENRLFLLYIFRLQWTFAQSNLETGFKLPFCVKLCVLFHWMFLCGGILSFPLKSQKTGVWILTLMHMMFC